MATVAIPEPQVVTSPASAPAPLPPIVQQPTIRPNTHPGISPGAAERAQIRPNIPNTQRGSGSRRQIGSPMSALDLAYETHPEEMAANEDYISGLVPGIGLGLLGIDTPGGQIQSDIELIVPKVSEGIEDGREIGLNARGIIEDILEKSRDIIDQLPAPAIFTPPTALPEVQLPPIKFPGVQLPPIRLPELPELPPIPKPDVRLPELPIPWDWPWGGTAPVFPIPNPSPSPSPAPGPSPSPTPGPSPSPAPPGSDPADYPSDGWNPIPDRFKACRVRLHIVSGIEAYRCYNSFNSEGYTFPYAPWDGHRVDLPTSTRNSEYHTGFGGAEQSFYTEYNGDNIPNPYREQTYSTPSILPDGQQPNKFFNEWNYSTYRFNPVLNSRQLVAKPPAYVQGGYNACFDALSYPPTGRVSPFKIIGYSMYCPFPIVNPPSIDDLNKPPGSNPPPLPPPLPEPPNDMSCSCDDIREMLRSLKGKIKVPKVTCEQVTEDGKTFWKPKVEEEEIELIAVDEETLKGIAGHYKKFAELQATECEARNGSTASLTIKIPVVTCAQVTEDNELIWKATRTEVDLIIPANQSASTLKLHQELATLAEAQCTARNWTDVAMTLPKSILTPPDGNFFEDVWDWITPDETVTINSLPELIRWGLEQYSGTIGDWGQEIEVPGENDGKGKIHIPDLATGISQIILLLHALQDDEQTTRSLGIRAIFEAHMGRQQSIQTNYGIEAILKYLACNIKRKNIDVPATFSKPNPEAIEDIDTRVELNNFLQNSYLPVPVIEYADEHDLKDDQKPLLDAAAVIMSVFAHRFKRDASDAELGAMLKRLIDAQRVRPGDETNDQDWDAWLNKVETGFTTEPGISDPQNPYGRDLTRRPRIREIGTEQADP